MIITLGFVALVIIGIIIGCVAYKNDIEVACGIGLVIALIAGVGTLACGGTIISNNINPESKLASINAEREAIVYQIENGLYLGDAVGKFNREVTEEQMNNKNPWLSWFCGDYIDEVELIKFD